MTRLAHHCTAVLLILPLATAAALAHESVDHDHAPPDSIALSQKIQTGDGDGKYESVPNWCKLPAGQDVVGPTHGGVIVAKDGNIYWSMDGGENGLVVYKPDGTFVKAIAPGLIGLHGLTLRTENSQQFIYAAHLNGKQIVKLKLDGAVVQKIGWPKESGKYKDENQYKPTAVAVGPNGDIYAADGYGQNWIHQWDKNGKYIRSFGGPGKEPGQFRTCHGLALDCRGDKPLLLVCDRENRRLQHFTLDGKFVAVIATDLRRPCAVSFLGDRIAVAELEARVTLLDADNKVIAHLGDNPNKKQWANYGVPPADWQQGIFTAPHGLSFDSDGNLYIMDWNRSGRLSKFRWIHKPDTQNARSPEKDEKLTMLISGR